VSVEQLMAHRRLWEAKPALRAAYEGWFAELVAVAPAGSRVLEIGSGPGTLSAYARQRRPDLVWIAAELIPTPWNDLTADALQLPLQDASLDAIVGLDVVHHLERPYQFLAEAARTLRPGGRLALVEPWVTPLSYPIYRWLHQEGCRLDLDPADPFGTGGRAGKPAFQGDAAVLWRLTRATTGQQWADLGFQPPRLAVWPAFAYLLTLGFRDACLLPRPLIGPALWLDRRTRWAASVLGMRALASWCRSC
jgi:SAM-dependent methyltransferase